MLWHAMDSQDCLDHLGSDRDNGLSTEEASDRLRENGLNRLAEEGRRSLWLIARTQFESPLVLLLIVAAGLALLVGERTDALTILVIVLLNAVLGFTQERKAERAIQELARMLAPRCHVIRDGQRQEIAAEDLVVGDLIVFEAGDRLPADVRILAAEHLDIDESVLTGESMPVHKSSACVPADTVLAERSNLAFMGTGVTHGHGLGLVVATGMETEFGKVAGLTSAVVDAPGPLHRKLIRLSRRLGLIALIACSLVVGIGLLSGKPLLVLVMTGISLAVAVVPEGLAAVVTVTLALGARAMARRHALLRHLQAAESLGEATVICTDKTGTLTENVMKVEQVLLSGRELSVTGSGYEPWGSFIEDGVVVDPGDDAVLNSLLTTALVCNHAEIQERDGEFRILGKPTEAALLAAAHKAGLQPPLDLEVIQEIPFDADRKIMTLVVNEGGEWLAQVKGAPETVLERSSKVLESDGPRPLTEAGRQTWRERVEEISSRGMRALALAQRPLVPRQLPSRLEEDLTLLGVVGIQDPPRKEVPGAIREAREAGIQIILITGDSPATAASIGTSVGLAFESVLTGPELEDLPADELSSRLRAGLLFARTVPADKLRIVERLQQDREIVAMTGDGVNDAPALKQADVGIAMGIRGTDVARQSSDIVLTDDNFASIVAAIEEGRRQLDNIYKFVRYLLSSNMGEILAILGNIAIGGPLILIPVQILWINLVTDGPTAIALGLEPVEEGTMQRAPRPVDERILSLDALIMILGVGTYVGAASLWLFQMHLGTGRGEDLTHARTLAFTGLIVAEKLNVLNFRSLQISFFRRGLGGNPLLLLAMLLALALQLAAIYVPVLQDLLGTTALGWADWGMILIVCAPILILGDLLKWILQKSKNSPGARSQTEGSSAL